MTRANDRFGFTEPDTLSDHSNILNDPLLPPSREQYRSAALTVVENVPKGDVALVLEALGIGREQLCCD